MAKKTRSRATKVARPVSRTKSKAAKRRSAPSVPKGAQDLPDYVVAQLFGPTSAKQALKGSKQAALERSVRPGLAAEVQRAATRMVGTPAVAESALPRDVRETTEALAPQAKRFHGAKVSLAWFPWRRLASDCADKFGYLTPALIRSATRLPFNPTTVGFMEQLGALMGDAGRETAGDSGIPAGFTYVGQFVDHDITLDVSSTLDVADQRRDDPQHADSGAGSRLRLRRGPSLAPVPVRLPARRSAANRDQVPAGVKSELRARRLELNGTSAGMKTLTDFDVPRMHNPTNPSARRSPPSSAILATTRT